jgi:DNA-binding SARP family transcriptional activator
VLNVHLFGNFQVDRGDTPLPGLEARKPQELLAYLLLEPARSHPRETLAGLLWPDPSSDQSKAYLRKALWQLQSALGEREPTPERLIQTQADFVRLEPGHELWMDVAAFEAAYATVRGTRAAELTDEQTNVLQTAVDLYRGDLLDGWYLDWCLFHRERLLQMYLSMLDKLMAWSELEDNYEAGLDYGDRILRHDRAHELTHRRLMRLHLQAGDRTAALRQYERCVEALKQDLGAAPDRRTTALYAAIRDDTIGAQDVSMTPFAATADTAQPSPSSEVVRTLKTLRRLLVATQREIGESIQRIEKTLH